MFETFAHTADVGLRVSSSSLNALFADAGRGLFSIIVGDLGWVQPSESVRVHVEGGHLEYLMVDWLSKLIEIFETRHMLFSQFDVRVSSEGLHAVVKGEPIDLERHRLEHEVKAVTYHGLKLVPKNGKWFAEIVLDI
jgi:SHS2 domain-containing protein